MSIKGMIVILLLMSASLGFFTAITEAPPALTMYIDPPSIINPSLTPGTSFTVDLMISDADYLENTDVYTWQVRLQWDIAIVDIDDAVTWGDFLEGPRIGPWGLLIVDAAAGQKEVMVTDGSRFQAGYQVLIQDDSNSETNTVASILGNQLTMSTNLAHTYTVAANGGAYPDPTTTPATNIRHDVGRLIGGVTTNGPAPGESGSGLLATFTFHVVGTGETTLNIDYTFTYIINGLGETLGDDAGELNKQSGYFANTGPEPTQISFSLVPNPAIIGQLVTLLGNLTTINSSPIGGAPINLKVNGNPVATLTTNSTGWFKASAPAPSTGTYTVRVEYAGSTEYLPSFDEEVFEVITGLSISIYTDKYTYQAGDTMHIGLNVSNAGSAIVVDFKIWVRLPSGGDYTYKEIPSVAIPAGLEYSNPNFDAITLPSIPPGKYTWHAAFLYPATTTIIVEDTAEWEFI